MAYRAGVPGLNKALREVDLEKSRNIYNQLPDDSQQPEVSESLVQELAALFVRNGAEKVFGIHLVHGHFAVPDQTVLVGVNHETPRCRWANAIPFQAIDFENVHGHIFVLTDHGFHPYEYQAGPVPDLSQVNDRFLAELGDFLSAHNLTTLVGLQFIDPYPHDMLELVLPRGTIMMDPTSLKGCVRTRQTGWKFEVEKGEIRVCLANEMHAQTRTGHEVYNKGDPHPRLDSLQDVENALAKAGILSVA